MNITIHSTERHHTCAPSAEWGIVIFVVCFWSTLSSLQKGCHRWLNYFYLCVLLWAVPLHHWLCLLNHMDKNYHLDTLTGFGRKVLLQVNLMHGNTYDISHVSILRWSYMTPSLTSRVLFFNLRHLTFDANYASSNVDRKGKCMLFKFVIHFRGCAL